jgi:hypothetical protein
LGPGVKLRLEKPVIGNKVTISRQLCMVPAMRANFLWHSFVAGDNY